MRRKIYLLVDYNNKFGTKYTAVPYRSGMNKELLKKFFLNRDFDIEFFKAGSIDFQKIPIKGQFFLYTSFEDKNGYYKSFLADVAYAIELGGGIIIPKFIYLQAHENKVFQELLRQTATIDELKSIKSRCFGSLEELYDVMPDIEYPAVLKLAKGSKSRGVFLVNNPKELLKKAKCISLTRDILYDLKDFGRAFRHKGYVKESVNRRKFLIQSFIPNLSYDWKVLVYGDKFYCIKRRNRKNDFRASGGGLLSYEEVIPSGLLDFAKIIKEYFNVPQISLDIAFDGIHYHLIEMQFVYFGTYTIEYSSFYFTHKGEQWQLVREPSTLEEVYADSIANFLEQKPGNN